MYSSYSQKYVPFDTSCSFPLLPSVPYIEGYLYKARKLTVSYTIGLLLQHLKLDQIVSVMMSFSLRDPAWQCLNDCGFPNQLDPFIQITHKQNCCTIYSKYVGLSWILYFLSYNRPETEGDQTLVFVLHRQIKGQLRDLSQTSQGCTTPILFLNIFFLQCTLNKCNHICLLQQPSELLLLLFLLQIGKCSRSHYF